MTRAAVAVWCAGVVWAVWFARTPWAWFAVAWWLGAVVTAVAGCERFRVAVIHRARHWPAPCRTGCHAARNRLRGGRARDRKSARVARDYLAELDRLSQETGVWLGPAPVYGRDNDDA